MTNSDNELSKMMKKSKGMLMFMGVLCVLLGILTISTPFFAGSMVTILVGALLLVSGILELLHAFQSESHYKVFTFLRGLFMLIAGGMILARPLFGLAMLTIMLAVFFLVDGLSWCVMAFQTRPKPGWGIGLFNGAVTFVLGILIWKHWPLSGVWAIGTLIGIRIMMVGWTMLFFSSVVESAATVVDE
jgi:uncharacterized membrane protein HdeD (DUF308 family)